jgi:hypothetical protein
METPKFFGISGILSKKAFSYQQASVQPSAFSAQLLATYLSQAFEKPVRVPRRMVS